MISEADVVGQPVTPAFLRLLKLQFTADEAALAFGITLTGGTLDELSARLGAEKDGLKEKLMARPTRAPSDMTPLTGTRSTVAWG